MLNNLQLKDFLIRSEQSDPQLPPGATQRQEPRAVLWNQQATSLRQLFEHRIGMIQGKFPHQLEGV